MPHDRENTMRVEKAKGGFTLIEMAVVLVIVGLILTVTLPLLTEGIARDKLVKGRQAASSLRDEIVGWALISGQLPSLGTVAGFASAEDPWGNRIAYWSDPELTEGGGTICNHPSSPDNLSLHDTNTGSTYTGVAFVIASRGPNRNLQVGYAPGPPVVVTTYPSGYDDSNFNDVAHGAGTGLTADYDLTATREERFDDVVQYVTYNYLRTRICTEGVGEPTGDAVGFDNITESFPKTADVARNVRSTNDAVNVDPVNNQINMGNDSQNAVGCIWHDGNVAKKDAAAGSQELECGTLAGLDAGVCRTATLTNVPAASGEWEKILAVFKFTVWRSDTTADSSDRQGGFTFAIISAKSGKNPVSDTAPPCGAGGAQLAYAGVASTVSIQSPKFGVEVDFFRENGKQDAVYPLAHSGDPDAPDGADDYLNHAATLGWYHGNQPNIITTGHYQSGFLPAAGDNNDNDHRNPGSATNANFRWMSPGWQLETNATGVVGYLDGFRTNSTRLESTGVNWLEDGSDHWMRVLLARTESGGVWTYTTHFWITDSPNAAFLNVNALTDALPKSMAQAQYYENSTIKVDSTINAFMDDFRFGWTMANTNTAGVANTVSISDFGLNATNR
jgi:prepilin-type N-terminal cleavage/methylation domain-containing protein